MDYMDVFEAPLHHMFAPSQTTLSDGQFSKWMVMMVMIMFHMVLFETGSQIALMHCNLIIPLYHNRL